MSAVERIDAVVEALLEPRAREQRGVCWREAHDGAEEEGEEAMAEHCVLVECVRARS